MLLDEGSGAVPIHLDAVLVRQCRYTLEQIFSPGGHEKAELDEVLLDPSRPENLQIGGGRRRGIPVGVWDSSRSKDQSADRLVYFSVADLRSELALHHVPEGIFLVMDVKGPGQDLCADRGFDNAELSARRIPRDKDARLYASESEGISVLRTRHPCFCQGPSLSSQQYHRREARERRQSPQPKSTFEGGVRFSGSYLPPVNAISGRSGTNLDQGRLVPLSNYQGDRATPNHPNEDAPGQKRAVGDEAVRSRSVGQLVATSVAVVAFVVSAGASAAPGMTPPSNDPFYRYTGKTPLAHIPAGTPLRQRSVTLGLDTTQTPLPAEQILYRTTDATGRAVASVTTVLLPATGTVAPRVVAYLSFYDALASKCDPSYTLRGGDPGAANKNLTDIEQVLVHALHAQGYIVTVPDFEDETLDYVAGTESGMSTLDGIKATLKTLKLDSSTPVGLVGYSGGSIAADWASELQPRYAPHVNLIGTAMGGIPVNLAHNLRYIDGSPSWSDVIPAAFIGISRSFHLDLTPYLSTWGRQVVATESKQCIGEMQGEFPNLTIKRLMKPQYADVIHVGVFRRIIDKLTMGTAPGHPIEPMLMVWGNSDGTGDGVMVAADEAKLAAEYCHQGAAVLSEEFKGLDHTEAAVAFFAQAFPWLASRFLGVPAPSNCA